MSGSQGYVCEKHDDLVVVAVDGLKFGWQLNVCPVCKMQDKFNKISELVRETQELNMGNYSEEQVRDLNNAMIEISNLLDD